jgi:hypothetical protein
MAQDAANVSIVLEGYESDFHQTVDTWLKDNDVKTEDIDYSDVYVMFSIAEQDRSAVENALRDYGPEGLYRIFTSSEGSGRDLAGPAFKAENDLRAAARGLHIPLGAKPSEIAASRKFARKAQVAR